MLRDPRTWPWRNAYDLLWGWGCCEPMTDDQETLVQRAGRGDADAVGQLLLRHLPAVRAYVRLRSGPTVRQHENDSDVVQSVCLELLQSLRGDGGFHYAGEAAFRSWLFTAALRKLVERDRYHGAGKRDAARVEPNTGDDAAPAADLLSCYQSLCTPSRVAIGRETLQQVERALDAMPEEQREVILLARLAGLSHREIAAHLGRTEVAVRSILSRSLARLARYLGEQ